MKRIQIDSHRPRRLRFVFDGTIVTYGLDASTTLEDIASTMADLSQRYGYPVSVDVTLTPPPAMTAPTMA